MRFCKSCKKLYPDTIGYCVDCGINTEPIGEINDTEPLFEITDIDKARSVNTSLRMAYIEACDQVQKTESKLRKLIAERDGAGNTWVKFWELINSGEQPITNEILMLEAGDVEDVSEDEPEDDTDDDIEFVD